MATRVAQLPSSAPKSTISCNIDSLEEHFVRGWAFDQARNETPAVLHIIIDGQEVTTIRCDGHRPDVRAAGINSDSVGFAFHLPASVLDNEKHRLEMRDDWRRVVDLVVNQQSMPSLDFTVTLRPEIKSFVDGLRQGAFEGWVLRKAHSLADHEGNVMVKVTCDGAVVGHVRANRYRGDVSRILSSPPNCGFQFVPPASVRRGFTRDFRFYAMPENVELTNSPQQTTIVTDVEEARLLALADSVDTLHRELTRIRRQVREMLPRPSFTLASYEAWFARHLVALRARVAQMPAMVDPPLVSVVCPVYRPDLEEFVAAVESVRAQTYTNWELILVDDNSRDAELTARITQFAAEDPRIRAVPRRKNGKISAATNTALEAATGAWVAFFDHDDLLVDVALSCMVRAALETPCSVLYSDEDKVDAAGIFSDPAFKPDWNHRLLLGVNYICHLLMVRRDVLETVGPLRSPYDGAQDHDLILRLSETVPASDIVHVPEILYHWRKTANSTASGIGAKSYAVDAGVRAVRDHLRRIGRPAEVKPVNEMTLYKVNFALNREPSVTIIIPFKDEIETTSQCIEALEARTAYSNWNVILVDNWSTSLEAEKFAARMKRKRNVRLMRVEEPFNYSRLNNLAAETASGEYFVFMNNDLFVTNVDWLTSIVSEAESDPKIAAVGGRFTYPNGSLQHAGVVTGIGGVAGHVHVGLPPGDGGYAGRANFTQELSAVTAAGVLVRRSAFIEVGGFDEVNLQVAFNDVDLCLKLRRAGYRIIYCPDFLAEHHESLSRGNDERPMQETRFFQEIGVMQDRWGDLLKRDPFYHPHFSLEKQPFFDLVDPA